MNRHSQRIKSATAALLLMVTMTAECSEFRVCAEPDNLPYSNRLREGFENKIAALLAKDLHAKLRFTWQKQRQGYIRETLNARLCDVIMGVPFGYQRVLSTQPYYRSGYVYISKSQRHLNLQSFDDPVLKTLKIGLHAIGNDGANSPPAHALAGRGIVDNVVGYSMWGEASVKNPQGQLIAAVAKGEIDIAMVWGPIGGYFAKPYGKALTVTELPADADMPEQPFAFDIAMGVRKDDQALAEKLDNSLKRNRRKIDDILTAYNIPRLQPNTASAPSPAKQQGAELNNQH